jgi:hypothetical protein
MVFRWLKSRGKASADQKPPAAPPREAQPPSPEAQARAAFAALPMADALAEVQSRQDVTARIKGYLQRRDLEDALWTDPVLAGDDALSAIEHASRNRNKRVNREARARQKTHREARQQQQSLFDRAQELIQAAERINGLAEHAPRDLTARTLIDEQWAALSASWAVATSTVAAQQPWPQLPPLDASVPRQAAPEDIQTDPDEPASPDPAAAVPAAALDDVAASAQAAAAKGAAELEQAQQTAAAAAAEAAAAALVRLEAAEPQRAALLATAAPAADAAPLDRLEALAAARREASALRKQIDWPNAQPEPESLQALKAWEQAQQQAERAAREALGPVRDQVAEDIVTLQGLIDEGATRKAQTLHASIRRAHPERLGLPKSAMAALNAASGTLRQLGTWAAFATSPKRDALLEAMTAAADKPIEAPLQAERIKELRRDWQALGPPRGEQERDAQARFDAAAERAFEPCKAYYDGLAEAREANAQARAAICDQLASYLEGTDWRSADFGAAEQILREARNGWREHHPVPRKQEKALSDRFEGLQGQLHDRLKHFWDANAAAKQKLIDQVTALASADDTALADRLNAAKTAQRDWQNIGRVPRKQDQALWQDFRTACDTLFSQRDAAQQEANRAADAAAEEARALLRDFAVASAEATPTSADAATLRTFENRFKSALAGVPARARRPLTDDAEVETARYRGLLARARQAAQAEALDQRASWDAQLAANPAAAPADAPDGLFGNSAGPVEETALRDFAVRAELWADVASPAEDAARRLELKVAALSAALGTGEGSAPSALDLANEWCALGAKPDTEPCRALRARFFAALRAGIAEDES